jgi:hypothetical protein
MLSDPDLSALFEQAARNLYALELLAHAVGHKNDESVTGLRKRLQELKAAYKHETDELTRQVLSRAVERRRAHDRRRSQAAMQTT